MGGWSLCGHFHESQNRLLHCPWHAGMLLFHFLLFPWLERCNCVPYREGYSLHSSLMHSESRPTFGTWASHFSLTGIGFLHNSGSLLSPGCGELLSLVELGRTVQYPVSLTCSVPTSVLTSVSNLMFISLCCPFLLLMRDCSKCSTVSPFPGLLGGDGEVPTPDTQQPELLVYLSEPAERGGGSPGRCWAGLALLPLMSLAKCRPRWDIGMDDARVRWEASLCMDEENLHLRPGLRIFSSLWTVSSSGLIPGRTGVDLDKLGSVFSFSFSLRGSGIQEGGFSVAWWGPSTPMVKQGVSVNKWSFYIILTLCGVSPCPNPYPLATAPLIPLLLGLTSPRFS